MGKRIENRNGLVY